jgi:PAS domain S-box-containing protein
VNGFETAATQARRDAADPSRIAALEAENARLRRSEAHYRAIVENASDFAIFTTDLEGQITSWNPGAEKLLGWAEAEALGEHACMIFTPADQAHDACHREMHGAAERGRAEDERWHRREDGSEFWASGLMMRFEDERTGEHVGYLKILRDRTPQHEADQRLARVLEQVPVGVGLFDADGRFTLKNPRLQDLLGEVLPSRDEAEGRRWQAFAADGRRLAPQDYPGARALRGEDASSPVDFRRDDGDAERWLRVSAVPVRDERGAVTGGISVVQEVTEELGVQRALRASEEFNRRVLGSSADCIKVLDLDGRLEFMSEGGMCVMEVDDFGAIQGACWPDFWQGEEHAKALAAVEEAKRGGTGRFQGFATTMKGAPRWWDVIVTPINGPDHKPEKLLSVSRDVTATKQAEERLRESEARFRNMADHAPVMMWVTDADGSCTYLNRRWYEFTGQAEEQALGFGWLDATHPGDRAEAERVFLAANAKHEPFRLEYRLRHADGSDRWAIDAASPRFSDDGTFLGYVGSVIDIDERRKAEERLRLSEERFRTALQIETVGAIYFDMEGRLTDANDAFLAMSGYGREDLEAGRLTWRSLTPPEWMDDSERAFAELKATGRTTPYEKEYLRRDGTRWWALFAAKLLPDGTGFEFVLDVTDRKEVEARLRESETQLRALADNIPLLCWIAKADGHIYWYNRRWYEYTGTSPETQEGWGWESVHDPERLPGIVAEWRRSLATGEPFETVFPLRAADGSWRTFLTRAVPIRDEAGAIVRWFGSNVDIEDQVRATAERARRTEQLQGLAEAALTVARAPTLEATLDEITQAARRIIGAHQGVVSLTRGSDWSQAINAVAITDKYARWREYAEMPDGGGIYAWLCEENRPVRMTQEELEAHPRWRGFGRHANDHPPMRGWLAAPLIGRDGRNLGLIQLSDKEDGSEFDADDEAMLVQLAQFASAAVEQAQAEAALRELNESLERRVEEAVAEREKTEEALRQAQKMEAVGQLTGGIAHDFNNLLTGVIGSLDMMQRRIAKGETDRIERYATAAMTSANRAAALTHRLLAFSRRQPLDPKPVNANRLVTGMEELLRRTIGEAIRLEIVTAGGLWQTLCDPHQLESAILNLAINARDAMQDGGQLTIETCNAHLDNAYAAQQREVKPGQYICICVTDTGTGMSPDVIAKASTRSSHQADRPGHGSRPVDDLRLRAPVGGLRQDLLRGWPGHHGQALPAPLLRRGRGRRGGERPPR